MPETAVDRSHTTQRAALWSTALFRIRVVGVRVQPITACRAHANKTCIHQRTRRVIASDGAISHR